jgi:hypothetical protein
LVNKLGNAFGSNSSASLSDAVFNQAGFPGANSIPIFATFQTTLSTGNVNSAFSTYVGSTPVNYGSGGYAKTGNGAVLSFSLGSTVGQLMIVTQCPLVKMTYQYYDNYTSSVETRIDIYAYAPALYQIYRNGTKIQESTADWQTQSIILLVENATPANYQIQVKPLETYDLNQSGTEKVWFYNHVTQPQASGGGITATAFGFTVLP